MNKRIKELAQQYACHTETMTGVETEYILDADDLQDFIDAVRQDEREACAVLCEKMSKSTWTFCNFAEAIRQRGEK